MRRNHSAHILTALAIAAALSVSCRPDFQEDIDGLKNKYASIEGRVGALEKQVSDINGILENLSVLSAAVEQNFYITEVINTGEEIELRLSNGGKLRFFNGPGNTLVPVPPISMTQVNGLYYWTLSGILLSDQSGNPIRSTDFTPLLKYDGSSGVLLISIDGGVTFKDISIYSSVVINETVLREVINNYFSINSSTFVDQQTLYQIVSSYIQRNYSELFSLEILDEVVSAYIHENYTRLFRYELLEEIFTQYDFAYYTSQIDVDHLVGIIVDFIREHSEILTDNEVLFEIISSYLSANQTTIFSSDILLGIINEYIENNQLVIDEAMLSRVVGNYIDKHRDTVFNTESVIGILQEYVRKHFIQAFSQTILMQLLSVSLSDSSTSLFNETLIQEIIGSYVQNNYSAFINEETLNVILNSYLEKNSDTILNVDILSDIISSYFQKNYNIFIDRTVLEAQFNNYTEKHKDNIISFEVLESILRDYMRYNFDYIFDYDLVNRVVTDYFENNTQIIKEYVSGYTGVIKDVSVTGDYCTVTLSNGSTVKLAVYDAYARLRDRVQSVVIVPDADGRIREKSSTLTYIVSPASMAPLISSMFNKDEVKLEFLCTDGSSEYIPVSVSEVTGKANGQLKIHSDNIDYSWTKTIALHVKENKTGGSDIVTEFTPVGSSISPSPYLRIESVDNSMKGYDYFYASLHNTKSDKWTDFKILRGYDSSLDKSYWYTDTEVPLDENDSYVYVWTCQDNETRTDNYVHFKYIRYLYYGYSNAVKTSHPDASISFKPLHTELVVFVRNTGTTYMEVKSCTLLWNDSSNPSRLATNANLNLISGKLESIAYTPYYWNGYDTSRSIKPGSFFTFSFPVVKIDGISENTLSMKIELGDGGTITRDVYKALNGDPGGSFIFENGIRYEIPFEVNWTGKQEGVENGHEWVDLGLPSGTKWATCNLGANKPENRGNYYAWGETKTKSNFSSTNYSLWNGNYKSITKYNFSSSYGIVDNKLTFADYQYADDAARASWGGSWRVPTYEELIELMSRCDIQVIANYENTGVRGALLTSKKNNKSIFLPAAGYKIDTQTTDASYCYYWSSSLYNNTDPEHISPYNARAIRISQSGSYSSLAYFRYYGFLIRPVLN